RGLPRSGNCRTDTEASGADRTGAGHCVVRGHRPRREQGDDRSLRTQRAADAQANRRWRGRRYAAAVVREVARKPREVSMAKGKKKGKKNARDDAKTAKLAVAAKPAKSARAGGTKQVDDAVPGEKLSEKQYQRELRKLH